MMMKLLFTLFVSAVMASSATKQECDYSKIATSFFDSCEKGMGWDGTKEFVVSEKSPFGGQFTDGLPGPPVTDVKTIKDYADWMAGVVEAFGKNATVDVQNTAIDHERGAAIFYAVFAGFSEYVYVLNFDEDACLIDNMTKVSCQIGIPTTLALLFTFVSLLLVFSPTQFYHHPPPLSLSRRYGMTHMQQILRKSDWDWGCLFVSE